MARKSRKNILIENSNIQNTNIQNDKKEKKYKVEIYARLSVEDIRKKESDSISVQINLINKYLENLENSELIEIYKDVNQTGTNFERPAFNELMSDIKNGKVNCIIVKILFIYS